MDRNFSEKGYAATGLSPRKLYLMRRFLRRLRWWGPKPPRPDTGNRHIVRALLGGDLKPLKDNPDK